MAVRIKTVWLVCLFMVLTACTSGDLEDGDHDLVLRIEQLQPYGLELPGNFPAFESSRRSRWFDGSIEVEYEFDAPGELGLPYLYSIAERHRSTADACGSYLAANLVLPLGLLGSGELSVRDDIFRYGDQSRFGLLIVDGEPVGNYFGMCRDKTTFMVVLGGLYFDDGELWGELVIPTLDAISSMN